MTGGLGFKDLRYFNLALLAKQVWRFETKPETLVSKLFKAKYFMNHSSLDVEVGYNPSFAWRSIHKAVPILRKGSLVDGVTGDRLWCYSASGIFSTKDAYKIVVALNSGNHDGEGCSSTDAVEFFWSCLWKLNIPEKIKIFLWRLYYEGIPIGTELRRRVKVENIRCILCAYEVESASHLFLKCWWSKGLWQRLGISFALLDEDFTIFADWLFLCVRSYDRTTMGVIAWALWIIWFNRNLLMHDKEGWDLNWAAERVRPLHQEYTDTRSVYQVQNISDDYNWIAPLQDVVKINTDGAFINITKAAGSGVIARDSNGIVLQVQSNVELNMKNSLETEGTALLRGMYMALKMKLPKVIFELDCATVAEMLWFGRSKSSNIEEWRMKCRDFLIHHEGWSICLIRREGNAAANWLAKNARNGNLSWDSENACPRSLGLCI